MPPRWGEKKSTPKGEGKTGLTSGRGERRKEEKSKLREGAVVGHFGPLEKKAKSHHLVKGKKEEKNNNEDDEKRREGKEGGENGTLARPTYRVSFKKRAFAESSTQRRKGEPICLTERRERKKGEVRERRPHYG